jgi:Cu/Zn superoxide dismutase
MTRSNRRIALPAAVAVTLVLAACPAPEEADRVPGMDDPAPAAEERGRVFQAQLQAVEGSGVTGTATVALDDDRIEVRIQARGFQPGQRVPQHVHMNSSCDQPGGILLNLDNDLSHPNEAPPRGDHYPTADGDGTLDYVVSRSLDDLREAARQFEGQDVAQFDLAQRVVNLHAEDMSAIACGALDEGDHPAPGPSPGAGPGAATRGS